MMLRGDILTIGVVGALALAARPRGGLALSPRELQVRERRAAAKAAREALLARSGLVMPEPRKFLDDGQTAFVFETSTRKMVVRVAPDSGDDAERELMMLDEDFEGGVTKIFAVQDSHGFLVTWKERVEDGVEWFLRRRYGDDEEVLNEVCGALCSLYDPGSRRGFLEKIRVLERYPETRGLGRAIRKGLPVTDLDLNSNLGVTLDGRVVAYDL